MRCQECNRFLLFRQMAGDMRCSTDIITCMCSFAWAGGHLYTSCSTAKPRHSLNASVPKSDHICCLTGRSQLPWRRCLQRSLTRCWDSCALRSLLRVLAWKRMQQGAGACSCRSWHPSGAGQWRWRQSETSMMVTSALSWSKVRLQHSVALPQISGDSS